jgi:hypothetical protein|tara:strand:+ start:87 stop:254 length:168 start_codon:yes stop_codon:yes gene_type:complete
MVLYIQPLNFIDMDYNDVIIFKTNKEDKAKLQAEADRLRINLSSLVRYKLFADTL